VKTQLGYPGILNFLRVPGGFRHPVLEIGELSTLTKMDEPKNTDVTFCSG
jgi:hypothetical protein